MDSRPFVIVSSGYPRCVCGADCGWQVTNVPVSICGRTYFVQEAQFHPHGGPDGKPCEYGQPPDEDSAGIEDLLEVNDHLYSEIHRLERKVADLQHDVSGLIAQVNILIRVVGAENQ